MALTFTANGFYDDWILGLGNKLQDMDGDTFKAQLYLLSDFKDRQAAILGDLSDASVQGTETLVSPSWAAVGTTNVIKWDANDITFSSVAGPTTVTGLAIFNDTSANDQLVCAIFDSPFPIVTTGNNIVIAFHANGIGTVTMT